MQPMKLIVQIPCYNEATTLPLVMAALPKSIPGIATIETQVIDDGSKDGTAEVARALGVTHIIRNKRNLGLAHTFRKGLSAALSYGADIVVNLDGDNQYNAAEIPRLLAPLLAEEADVVIGSRDISSIRHFSPTKKLLQHIGSWVVRRFSGTEVRDATSGFRAFNREALLSLTILSNYTYTLESILQVNAKGLTIVDVPISVNPKTRESRLIPDLRTYLTFSAATIIRVFTMYNPLKVFIDIGVILIFLGVAIVARFLYFYLSSGAAGLIQSLIFAAVFIIAGIMTILVGLMADIIQFNRRLLEELIGRVRTIESSTRRGENRDK